MDRHVKFIASSVTLLVFMFGGVSAKSENYVRVLENSDYIEALKLLVPEKLFTNYTNADDEAWLKSTCRRDLLILEEAIRRRELWALTMLDASSKLPSGLLQGNLIDFGQYDECLAVHSNSTKYDIRGRHCMYSISPTQGNFAIPINPTLSVCLPAACSSNDIVSFFNTAILRNDNLKDLKIQIISATCSSVDPIIWDLEFTLCIALLACLVTFLVTCTVIELCHKNLAADGYDNRPFVSTLAGFSLRKSAASILNMEIKEESLPAIPGIRFLNTVWAVLAHEYLISSTSAKANTRDFAKWIGSWNSLCLFLASYGNDTFLAMSGFLMTYLFLKQMPKHKRFNVPIYYFHRYFRLTPPMIASIAIAVIILPKLGSGPQWDKTMSMFAGSCRTKWWSHIFYLHNFVEKDSTCLFHLWYLAVNMQLIWISPLILYPLYKTPKFGLSILFALFLASLAFPALVIGTRQLPASSFTHSFRWNVTMEVFGDIYINPFHRAGAWLVGIFWGYDVAMHNRQLNRWAVITGWLTATVSLSFCIFGMRSFMDPDYEYNVVWETFYSTVSRPIWAVGVCWIIYACIKNCAGPLSSILSSRIFLPFNKLSYCIHLVHICLQVAHAGSLRRPMYFSDHYIWRSFLSTLVMSIGAAFLFSLLFESPIMVLEKMLLKRKRESHSKHKEN